METITESLMGQGSFWLPRPATQIAQDIDTLFYVILWGSVLIFLVMFIIGLMFIIKYKRTGAHVKAKKQVIHNDVIETAWTVIPLIVVMIIFFYCIF